MSTRLALPAAVAALLATGLPALAADHGPGGRGMPSFAELDTDGNGEVSESEIEAHRRARFAEVDSNGDGEIDRAEFIAHAQARASERAGAMFDRLDADGDGVLPGDLVALRNGPGADRIIARLDADGSGGISAEEFEAGKARREARREQRRGGGHRMRHGGGLDERRN